jgi:hypothetical protein
MNAKVSGGAAAQAEYLDQPKHRPVRSGLFATPLLITLA